MNNNEDQAPRPGPRTFARFLALGAVRIARRQAESQSPAGSPGKPAQPSESPACQGDSGTLTASKEQNLGGNCEQNAESPQPASFPKTQSTNGLIADRGGSSKDDM